MGNLIDRLGGYENSRGLLNLYEYSISFKYYKEFDGDFESAGYVDVFVPDLKDALLEYRRQHNIFEVGDLVTYKAYFKWMWREGFGKITEIDEDLEVVNINDSIGVSISEIEHATNEEIKAGIRL